MDNKFCIRPSGYLVRYPVLLDIMALEGTITVNFFIPLLF